MSLSFIRTTFLLSVCSSLALIAADPITLFDGKTLDGWNGNPVLWKVEDGCITGETQAEGEGKLKHNSFLIWKNGTVSDFEITFEYRILSDWANSGLQYRSKEMDNFVVAGYQADIESGTKYSGINYGEKTNRGILAERGTRVVLGDGKTKKSNEKFANSAELQKVIKGKGEWNTYKVVAKGNTMSHYINDTLMSETIDESEKDAVKEGIIAFQLHQGKPMKIQFRNIILTPAN